MFVTIYAHKPYDVSSEIYAHLHEKRNPKRRFIVERFKISETVLGAHGYSVSLPRRCMYCNNFTLDESRMPLPHAEIAKPEGS